MKKKGDVKTGGAGLWSRRGLMAMASFFFHSERRWSASTFVVRSNMSLWMIRLWNEALTGKRGGSLGRRESRRLKGRIRTKSSSVPFFFLFELSQLHLGILISICVMCPYSSDCQATRPFSLLPSCSFFFVELLLIFSVVVVRRYSRKPVLSCLHSTGKVRQQQHNTKKNKADWRVLRLSNLFAAIII